MALKLAPALVRGIVARRGEGKTLFMTADTYNYMFSPFCPSCNIHWRGYPQHGLLKGDRGQPMLAQCPANHKRRSKRTTLWIYTNWCEACAEFRVEVPIRWRIPCPKCHKPIPCLKEAKDLIVIANYEVKYADMYVPQIAHWLTGMDTGKMFPSEAFNGHILLDEATAVARSERGMSTYAILLGTFAEQIRKRGITLTYTLQRPDKFNKDMLYQTDMWINTDSPDNGRSVHTEWYDNTGQYSRNFVRSGWPQDRYPDHKGTLSEAYRYWGMYPTEEVIESSIQIEAERRRREKKDTLVPVRVPLTGSTMEKEQQMTEMDKIFEAAAKAPDGVPLKTFQGRFNRKGYNKAEMVSEMHKRGFYIDGDKVRNGS